MTVILDQFPLQRKELSIKLEVLVSEAILSPRLEGVQVRTLSVRDDEEEQLVLRTGRCHHPADRVRVRVVPRAVGNVNKGCHQGIPISARGVFGGFCGER